MTKTNDPNKFDRRIPEGEPEAISFDDMMKKIGDMVKTSAAQHSESVNRDEKEAAIMTKHAAEAATRVMIADANVQAFAIAGVPYGDGKEIIGMGTCISAHMSQSMASAIMLNVVPELVANWNFSLRGKLRIIWRILTFKSKKGKLKPHGELPVLKLDLSGH